MLTPKRLQQSSVNAALEKAAHYRLLNEPIHAESICLDVLEVEPENQRAIITLLLALTDQFPRQLGDAFQQTQQLLEKLKSEYDRHYYEGIVHERWAGAQLQAGAPEESFVAWIRQAIQCYERAQELAEPSNPDPTLRWNACLRMLQRATHLEPTASSLARDLQDEFGEDVPPR